MDRKPLLVAWGQEFVDEILDDLGPDVVMQVALGKPSDDEWRAAPLVLIDSRLQMVAERMPAHRKLVVVAPSRLDGERLAACYAGWKRAFPDLTVYHWPYGVEAVRKVIVEAAEPRPEVRVGVIGGHGGAGATTLAVALALVAVDEGRSTVLVDADPLGGVRDRIGTWADKLTVVEHDGVSRAIDTATVAGMMKRFPAEVKVVDLSRSLDAAQLAVAGMCDIVFVVADARRNERATRRVMCDLAESGVRFALVPRWMYDETARDVATSFGVPMLDEMPLDPRSLFSDGRINQVSACSLLEFARTLLSEVPELAAVAAV